MRHASWMEDDERTPEEIRRDRLRNLRHQESSLLTQLDKVRSQINDLEK